jgi:superfamily II DNA helicase RecQ
LEDHRFQDLWGVRKFTNDLINIVLDEAHVIKDWGASFRGAYDQLGALRYLLPPGIPYHLGTATLAPDMVPEIKSNLHLRDNTHVVRLSSDRPNIFLRVHRMQFPVSSYHDLAFLIESN